MEVKEDPVGCPQCEGRVFYRKSTYFGRKVYYKVCNKCGWYRVYPKNEWIEICFGISPDSDDEIEDQEENSEEPEKNVTQSDQDRNHKQKNSSEDQFLKEEIKNNLDEQDIPTEEEPPLKPPRKKGRKRGRKPKKTKEEPPPDEEEIP